MPIDPNLLIKIAKVYEAAEAVEGMKPKQVFESHKKCAPGEFGMHKEGQNVKESDMRGAYLASTNFGTLGGLIGGGLGGVGGLAAGALNSRKGRRVRDTLRGGLKGLLGGGLVGAGAGAGAGAVVGSHFPLGAMVDAEQTTGQPMTAAQLREHIGPHGINPATFLGLTTLGGLGGAGLGGGLAGYLTNDKKDKKEEDNDEKEEKKSAASSFGEKVAVNVDWNALKTPALGGAAAGALAGGLSGLIAPGTDENGKTRSRFGAMLRRALGYGALGAAGGAALGHFKPNLINDYRRLLFGKMDRRSDTPTTPTTAAPRIGLVPTTDEILSGFSQRPATTPDRLTNATLPAAAATNAPAAPEAKLPMQTRAGESADFNPFNPWQGQ